MIIWTSPCLIVAILGVAYLDQTICDKLLVPQELKFKVP